MMISRLKNCWVVLFLGLYAGCANDPNTLGLSNSTFSADYGVVVVDTVTVRVSTVLLDSFPTSDTGALLIGGYTDDRLGRMQAEGYLQLGIGTSWTPPADAIFDSLVLIASFNGYSYGDTTAAHTVEVRRITQPFQTWSLPQFWVNENQYSSLFAANSKFNASAMRYDAQPLGTRTIRVRPNSSDSLMVRLNDELGREWLGRSKAQAPDLVEQARFLEYFKGIVITSAGPVSVIGLTTDNIRIRLYYKTYVAEQLTQQYHDYPFSSGLFNYSRFTADRTNTRLSALSLQDDEVAAADTENIAFIQSGSGLVTKVTFPYITRLITLSDVLLVNHAQLIIEPVRDTYTGAYPLPSSLTLYHTDRSNLPGQRVYANYNTSAYLTAGIGIDEEFATSTGYQFPLTQYAQELLSTDGNQDKALLIMPTPDELNTTVNRVYLSAGADAHRVRLKIWYTKSK